MDDTVVDPVGTVVDARALPSLQLVAYQRDIIAER
jgi:hypothetical protein